MWNQVDVVWMFPSGTIVAAAVAKSSFHHFHFPQRNKLQNMSLFVRSISSEDIKANRNWAMLLDVNIIC